MYGPPASGLRLFPLLSASFLFADPKQCSVFFKVSREANGHTGHLTVFRNLVTLTYMDYSLVQCQSMPQKHITYR